MNDNHGIANLGSGSINAGAMAVGPAARASFEHVARSDEIQEVRDRLDALIAGLREAAGRGDINDGLVESGAQVMEELNQEKPNWDWIRESLRRLKEGVGEVGNLAVAVQSTHDAVSALF